MPPWCHRWDKTAVMLLMEGAGCKGLHGGTQTPSGQEHQTFSTAHSLQTVLTSQVDAQLSPAPLAPHPAHLHRSRCTLRHQWRDKTPTSSNPTAPTANFHPFRPISLLSSTAFKQSSQAQQGLRLCLLLLFAQQPHPHHFPVLSLVRVSPQPDQLRLDALDLDPSASVTPGTQDPSPGNLNPFPPRLPDDMSD